MSLFNYNFFPILFFLMWNILYVKPFFSQKSNVQSPLNHTLRLPKNREAEPDIDLLNLMKEVSPQKSSIFLKDQPKKSFLNKTNDHKNLFKILLQPEITKNQFSDYIIKEQNFFKEKPWSAVSSSQTLKGWRNQKQLVQDTAKLPIQIFLNNKIQSKNLTSLFGTKLDDSISFTPSTLIKNHSNLNNHFFNSTYRFPQTKGNNFFNFFSKMSPYRFLRLSSLSSNQFSKLNNSEKDTLFLSFSQLNPKRNNIDFKQNLEKISFNWLKQWYYFNIKPFSINYKTHSLNQFHLPKHFSDLTYIKNRDNQIKIPYKKMAISVQNTNFELFNHPIF
nr:hypothetical protein [Trentepohlia sp. YN1242]